MASPQTENGYTRIANEILEALSRVRLSACEWNIMICIIRRTYGFGHKVWEISLGDFSSATSIDKPNVRRAIRALISKQMITADKTADSNRVSYGLQKDYGKWKLRGLKIRRRYERRRKGENNDLNNYFNATWAVSQLS